jgi:hypothetical protein
VDPFDRAAFGDHSGALVGQVGVADVEVERLAGAGGGLIQQPPQGLVAQPEVAAAPQRFELAAGQGAGAVGVLTAAGQPRGGVRLPTRLSGPAAVVVVGRLHLSAHNQPYGSQAAWWRSCKRRVIGHDV